MQQKEVYIAIIFITIIIVIFIVGIVLIIYQYRKKKLLHLSERNLMALHHQKELHEATLQMQQLTMQDIGREIHDGVGQRLTLASIYSKQLIHKNIPDESKQKMEEVSKLINESLIQLRVLSKELISEEEHVVALNDLVLTEVEKIEALEVCKIKLTLSDEIYFRHNQAMFVIRILQEFIQNSLKYASCTIIDICLQKVGNHLVVKIIDNGIGFDTHGNYQGIGLKNMKKRAEMIHADYIFESVINKGTQLTLKLNIS